VAAPLFARIAGYMVRRTGLAPVIITEQNILKTKKQEQPDAVARIRQMAQQLKSNEEQTVPDLRGLALREALNRVRGTDLKLKVKGQGFVSSMEPAAGEPLPKNRTIKVMLQ